MRYQNFGQTGHLVSALGFGAMRLPGVPLEQANEALNYALDHGINYIDTASAYKNSEEIIGECISHRRGEYFLATKVRARDYDSAKAEIERSLQRLKTDYVDLLQIHYVNYVSEFKQVMSEDGAYRAALEAKHEGKVRFLGISGHRPELMTQWIAKGEFDQVLFHLNLTQPFALDDLVPEATRLGMGKTVMKPLSGGFIQPVHKAMRYPYSQNVDVIISGMTSAREVAENLTAFEWEVSPEERRELENLAREFGGHDCRRCNYCSCPIGIPIPDFMVSSVVREKFGLLSGGQAFYAKHKEKIFSCADYEPCKEKPLCEDKCPYQLPMQRVVQSAMAYYG